VARRLDAPAEIMDSGAAIGDALAKNLIGRRDDAPAEIDMAAQQWDALAEMRIAARQWDAPANQRDGIAAMGCTSQSKRWRRGDGMRRPIKEKAAWQ
jgi:hypothetical protein